MSVITLTQRDLPELRGFVRAVWLVDRRGGVTPHGREISLPTGATHIAFRLSGRPLGIFDSMSDAEPVTVGVATVGGIRARPVFKALDAPDFSVGAMLETGAEAAVLGIDAGEIAGRHIALSDLVGLAADDAFDKVSGAVGDAAKLTAFVDFLSSRLRRELAPHPVVAGALGSGESCVGSLVKASGFSHRYFVDRFRRGVGLAPKEYFRVRRFARALRLLRRPSVALADVAFSAGYADQPHFSREFREMSGVTPTAYRAALPVSAHHFRIDCRNEVRFLQDGGREGR